MNVTHPAELKELLDQVEQLCDFLRQYHQHNNQPRQGCHGGLFLPSRTGQYLIENGHNDSNGGYFKHKINFHIK